MRAIARPGLGTWFLGIAACCGPAWAQQGDRAGETQAPPPVWMKIPPAPVVPPEETLDRFVVADGFRVELVAAEPLLEDPIQVRFGPDGRLWVLELRGYMPDVDGTNETAPVGRVATLFDDDGDGRMDRRETFADGLVLARSIAPVYDGLLVIEPPDLVFLRDVDGDGRSDERSVLASGFGGIDSPEHAGNGLLPALDNWIHCSQHPVRFRFDGVSVATQPTPGHGQWGIAMDDVGRLFYTTNSDPLRADLVPLQYASRHPGLRALPGVNQRIAHDFTVHPIRVNPGVNRGYQKGTLRDDGRLAKFTSACGPVIYRDDRLGVDVAGNAFICEPAGNLIKRYALRGDESLEAVNVYADAEFLASDDERFRPVNLEVGPDGALYIVDFYRGIIQHRVFVTSYLRRQIVERGLAAPVGLGRLYRVVAASPSTDDAERTPNPNVSTRSDHELVELLEHPGGWWRDAAQRLLIERRATDVDDELRRLATRSERSATRLHAWWTLEGLGRIEPDDVRRAAQDHDPFVRATAARLAEPFSGDVRVEDVLGRLARNASPLVRAQATLSLGTHVTPTAAYQLRTVAARDAASPRGRAALTSGMYGREADFIGQLVRSRAWRTEPDGGSALVKELVRAALRTGRTDTALALLDLAFAAHADASWMTRTILATYAEHLRVDKDRPRTLGIVREPTGWVMLLSSTDAPIQGCATQLDEVMQWPGRPAVRAPRKQILTPVEQRRYARGHQLFATHCVRCHRDDGRGQPAIAPTLCGTDHVLGDDGRLVRVLLNGMTGPLEVDGQSYAALMPESGAGDDDSIAALLTYVRQSWGNDAPPVAPARVAEVRARDAGRGRAWTDAELSE